MREGTEVELWPPRSTRPRVFETRGLFISQYPCPVRDTWNVPCIGQSHVMRASTSESMLTRMEAANDITFLGNVDYRSDRRRFGIKLEDRFLHTYIIGKT